MKRLLFYTFSLLFITAASVNKESNSNTNVADSYLSSISNEPIEKSENINLGFINLKNYTMTKIEKNNQEIIQITEEIKEAQRIIELERTRRIKNLKEQNTKLKNQLTTYKSSPNAWDNFKYNFSTNFKRMGLPFSELFPKTTKN